MCRTKPSKRRKLGHTTHEVVEDNALDIGLLFQPDSPSCYSKTRGKCKTEIGSRSSSSSDQSNFGVSVESGQMNRNEVIDVKVKILPEKKAHIIRGESKVTQKSRITNEKKLETYLGEKMQLKFKSFERVAAAVDDHIVSPPSSPNKRVSNEESQKEVVKKRGRQNIKTRVDHVLQSNEDSVSLDGYSFDLFTKKGKMSVQKKSGCKKLVLNAKTVKSENLTITDNVDNCPMNSVVSISRNKLDAEDATEEKETRKNNEKKEEIHELEADFSNQELVRGPIKTTLTTVRTKLAKQEIQAASTASVKNLSKNNTVYDKIETPMMDKVMQKIQAEESKKAKDGVCKSMESRQSSEKVLPSAAAVKAKLLKCGKLAELQEQLSQMNKDVKKVKVARKKAEEVAANVKKQEGKTEVNPERETKVPAYEKFHTLAQPVPPTLALPYKYKLLSEMFRTADTVVSMMHNRHEICSFNKLKAAVEQMLRKAFETRNLGQIRQVYPTAYKYRQERNLLNINGRSSEYQLTVEPVLDGDSADDVKSPRKVEPFQASQLIARKTMFHTKLIDIVKQHHREFLSKLERPLSVPDNMITRWHPKFPLDQIPDIEPASLPEPPYVQKVMTAKEALKSASDKFSEKVKKALKSVANSNDDDEGTTVDQANAVNERNMENKDSRLAGVNQSLLERIRAKEARNTILSMVMSPSDEKRQLMMSRLPALTRSLRSIFVTEKRPALPIDDCLKKLADSYTSSISTGEVEKHLLLMMEILPDWIQIVRTTKGKFVKIDRNRDLAAVHERIQKQVLMKLT